MRGFNVQEFKSAVDLKGGVMRNNKFLVEIPAPPKLMAELGMEERNLSFFCKAIPLPGIGIMTQDNYRYGYGPANRIPYKTVFNDLMAQFYVDASGMVRGWFRSWIKSITNPAMPYGINSTWKDMSAYEFSYKEDYAVDIRITSFDPEGNARLKIVLCECFPNYLGEVYQDWDDKNSSMILPVSLTYRDWFEEFVPANPVPIAIDTIEPYYLTQEFLAKAGERG